MNPKKRSCIVALFVSVTLLLLAGCVTVSKEDIAQADFGVFPTNFEADIKNLMAQRLKDPYSAVYRFGTPRRGYCQDGLAVGHKKHFGWVVAVGVNAKNAFGAYVGEEIHYFLIAEGRVSDVTGMYSNGMARYVD